MKLREIMNPQKKDIPTECQIYEGLDFHDVRFEDIVTQNKYVGVVNKSGEQTGVISADILRYLIRSNRYANLEQIINRFDIGVVAIDVNSRIFYVNSAYSRILGVVPGKIIGRYMNVIEKDAALLDVLRTGEPKTINTQKIKTLNKYVRVKMYPLKQDDEIIGAYSLFQDITEVNELTQKVEHYSQMAKEYKEKMELNGYLEDKHIIGESPGFHGCIRKAALAAGTDATVLIRGENGTGKESICNLVCEKSQRRHAPFIKVNCGAIPETLMESVLFGYEDGAFTGAKKGGHKGKIEEADGGTLFLDEIGDVPLPMQVKLLRFLQEGEVEKIGGKKPVSVDVRVIAATNRPLEEMIKDGTFRMDLYYRLNVVSIEVPPLRERGTDVFLLANEFLAYFNRRYHKQMKFADDAYASLSGYDWPGNVRELRNVVESAVVLGEDNEIHGTDFTIFGKSQSVQSVQKQAELSEQAALPEYLQITEEDGLEDRVRAFERYVLLQTLKKHGGSRKLAMEELQMSKRTFYRKMADYEIDYGKGQ